MKCQNCQNLAEVLKQERKDLIGLHYAIGYAEGVLKGIRLSPKEFNMIAIERAIEKLEATRGKSTT